MPLLEVSKTTMSIQRYLITMSLATVISAASWLLVLIFLDPETSGIIGLTLFFLSFFLMIFGLVSIVGFVARRLLQRREESFRLVAVSFRHAALLALLLTSSLFLQSQRVFTWWTAILLLIFLTLIEAFFAARETARVQKGGSRGA